MLTDREIVELKIDPEYKKAVSAGLWAYVRSLSKVGTIELKRELNALLKLVSSVCATLIVRNELDRGTRGLLERFLNRELAWPRSPLSVQEVCEADSGQSMWLRYDATCTAALFARSKDVINSAGFRHVVKRYSSIQQDKNARLAELVAELGDLASRVERSISTRAIFDEMVRVSSQDFYKSHEADLERSFRTARLGGALGALPEPSSGDAGDKK